MLSSGLDLLGGGASRPSRWQVGMQSGARSGASCVGGGGRGTGWSCGNVAYLRESMRTPSPAATSPAAAQACLGQGPCAQETHSILRDPGPDLGLGSIS